MRRRNKKVVRVALEITDAACELVPKLGVEDVRMYCEAQFHLPLSLIEVTQRSNSTAREFQFQ